MLASLNQGKFKKDLFEILKKNHMGKYFNWATFANEAKYST